jgi:glutathione gamma-glutamylcysteinyltransferase
MTSAGFYRRPLPHGLVAFASAEGRAIFREALAEGGMEGYFSLAEQFHTQAEPAFCGLGTLVTVLNALAIDPGRIWKGSWRWYAEELLDCCRPLDEVKKTGVTMPQLTCLARCNGAAVDERGAERTSLDALRAAVVEASGSAGEPHVVAAYARPVLGQTGGGHYSPVGGYHRGRDLALLLDVARFKYPPHWVPLPLLWEAMQAIDEATGRPRGYLVFRRGDMGDASVFRVGADAVAWRAASAELVQALASSLPVGEPASLDAALRGFIRRISPRMSTLVDARADHSPSGLAAGSGRDDAERVFAAIRETRLFQAARCAVGRGEIPDPSERGAELATLLLLACPNDLCERWPEAVRPAFRDLLDHQALRPELLAEVAHLRAQMIALQDFCCQKS